jgi:hypothetical protein
MHFRARSIDYINNLINRIIQTKLKYMVMFHDDDMMHPDYVETMFPFIQKEGVSAVGCNAFLWWVSTNIFKVMARIISFNHLPNFFFLRIIRYNDFMHFYVRIVFQSLRIRLTILKLIKSLTMKRIF